MCYKNVHSCCVYLCIFTVYIKKKRLIQSLGGSEIAQRGIWRNPQTVTVNISSDILYTWTVFQLITLTAATGFATTVYNRSLRPTFRLTLDHSRHYHCLLCRSDDVHVFEKLALLHCVDIFIHCVCPYHTSIDLIMSFCFTRTLSTAYSLHSAQECLVNWNAFSFPSN